VTEQGASFRLEPGKTYAASGTTSSWSYQSGERARYNVTLAEGDGPVKVVIKLNQHASSPTSTVGSKVWMRMRQGSAYVGSNTQSKAANATQGITVILTTPGAYYLELLRANGEAADYDVTFTVTRA
jgi:hypothetical protein